MTHGRAPRSWPPRHPETRWVRTSSESLTSTPPARTISSTRSSFPSRAASSRLRNGSLATSVPAPGVWPAPPAAAIAKCGWNAPTSSTMATAGASAASPLLQHVVRHVLSPS